ncbi:ArdC-like ssDNA-binding domain-containing protein [Bartonella sp. F02]|uniref:ArdC-like ssDNA-binding domain-containing protein n=1 Tax=Bartonella sp. F02 TaxID=2967262 RepID=UPI0022A9C5FB|nr:ArdC-like ssDNA-binding domain-containing protein [Bartonella sp. F02]MCZ2328963.1 ArdC-like ssDNA-binding domain-containing protein [Bartonella sp. F02]
MNDRLNRGEGYDMISKKELFSEIVAKNLIKQIKAGTAPWQIPWKAGSVGSNMPMNPITGNRYKGVNALHLMSQNRADSRWMTYKQAKTIGAQVRRGEKGTLIKYWQFSKEQNKVDENGNPVKDSQGIQIKETLRLSRPLVFISTVFNAEQIDDLPALEVKIPDWNPIERAENIIKNSGVIIRHGEDNKAFYKLATDSIYLPNKVSLQMQRVIMQRFYLSQSGPYSSSAFLVLNPISRINCAPHLCLRNKSV